MLQNILDCVTERTAGHVGTVTSQLTRMPFEETTRELESRGIEVLLDAARSIGIVPLIG